MVRYVNICHVCTATFVHPDNHFGILCIPERERTPETVKFIDFKGFDWRVKTHVVQNTRLAYMTQNNLDTMPCKRTVSYVSGVLNYLMIQHHKLLRA